MLFETPDGQEEILGFLGRTTNNVAEYAGLLAALTWARRRNVDTLILYSDSQLLVRQFSGAYKVKAAHLVPLFLQVLRLRRSVGRVDARHVPRDQNNPADSLANRAIDERVPVPDWLELDVPTA